MTDEKAKTLTITPASSVLMLIFGTQRVHFSMSYSIFIQLKVLIGYHLCFVLLAQEKHRRPELTGSSPISPVQRLYV